VKSKIASFVIILHVIPLAWVLFFVPVLRKNVPKKHLVVKTITPPPKTQVKNSSVSSSAKKPSSSQTAKKAPTPAKKAAPAQNKKPSTNSPKKPSETKAAPVVKKDPKIPKELLQELQESISKLDEKLSRIPEKPSKSLPNPKVFTPLSNNSKEYKQWIPSSFLEESNYEETLAQMLHQSLNLPEYGEVKIQITLKQDGSVIHLKVLSAESEKNKTYLEKHLPHLRFPRFSGSLSEKKEHTFTLTFCNEI
jgi:hypothetical protein